MSLANEPGNGIWSKHWRLLLLFTVPLALIYAPFLWNEFAVPYGGLGAEQDRYDVAGGDFINIWAAAKLALAQRTGDLYAMERFNALQKTLLGHDLSFYSWSYPPLFLPFIVALGLLPYLTAFVVWTAGTFALYAGSLAAYRPKAGWLAVVLLLAPASFINICDGQNGFLSAGLLVLGLRLLQRKPVMAGICFGLLIFKPHLGLMVPVALLAGKHAKAFLSACFTVLALAALSWVLFGGDAWDAYFTITAPYQRMLLESSGTELWALKWPTAFIAARNLGASVTIAYEVAGIAALGCAAAVFYAFRTSMSGERQNAILLTATVLASPYLNNYDLTIASAAVAVLLMDKNHSPTPVWLLSLMGAVWLLPLFVTTMNAARLPLVPASLFVFLAMQIYAQMRSSLEAIHAKR